MKNNEVRYSASVSRQSECNAGNTEKKDRLVETDERRVVENAAAGRDV